MTGQLVILFEDEDIIVVYKPAGIASQTKKVGEKDIVSEIKNHLKGGYVGVIHRLDQPVEGVLVFAKNKESAAELSAQVKEKGEAGFQKEYTAIVMEKSGESSVNPDNEIRLEDYILKEKEGIARIIPASDKGKYPEAKKASLSYVITAESPASEEDREAEETFGGFMLKRLRVNLETGRFHQIRVQLANAGMPIVGDRKYGTPECMKYAEEKGIRQILLCADSLVFMHPRTGVQMQFSMPPFIGLEAKDFLIPG